MLNGGSGSGVIVSEDGLVITAAHVTSEPDKQLKVLLSDGRELPATSLGVDHETDGALLQINAPGPFPFRPYVETKTYEVGDWVIATGHPGGPVVDRPSPLRLGRISQAGIKSGFSDAITTSAMVISGDSGGPLYNLKGEVIGINSNISGSWRINKHVPLPSIIARWDELLDGAAFGRPMQETNQQTESLFDEPYAKLRDRFEEALEKHADKAEAAELLARPRLLDPHHMQAFLNKWEPDPEADKSPQYGFTLESSEPRIVSIIPESPAANAGLKKGDLITAVDGEEIHRTISLTLKLKAGKKLSLTLQSGKTLSLKPREVIARAHFPQPVAGVINMMVTDTPDDGSPQNIPTKKFLAPLSDLRETFNRSILPLKNDQGRIIVSGTVISESLVTTFEGNDYQVRVEAIDEENDLALVQVIAAPILSPISWEPKEPKVGQLLLTPTSDNFLSGVITQPARIAPKRGYELNVTTEKPSAYLGVTCLLEGDEILEFEDRTIESIDALVTSLTKLSAGEKVTLVIKRGEEELVLKPILDTRPATEAGTFDRSASQRDGSLSSLSARGGRLSKRRAGFPRALYHDQALSPSLIGTPLLNLEGQAVGLNIARSLRHRSLAIPTDMIDRVVAILRQKAATR